MRKKEGIALAVSVITYLFLPPADLSRVETLLILFLGFCGAVVLLWKMEELRDRARRKKKNRSRRGTPKIINLSEKHYYKLRKIS